MSSSTSEEGTAVLTDNLVETWLQEQLEIASKVVIPPDDSDELLLQDNNSSSSDSRFLRIPLHLPNQDEYDNEGALDRCYYGGVDVVYKDWEFFTLTTPYIPSFLAFREIDPLQRLVEKQQRLHPELAPLTAILVDGNGILHPRQAGIACFLGVRTGIPTIGIGKSLFCEGGLTKEIVWRGVEQSLHAAAAAAASFSSHTEEPYLLVDQSPISSKTTTSSTITIIDENKEEEEEEQLDRGVELQKLEDACHGCCWGLAIPLAVVVPQKDSTTAADTTTSEERILACALVGHGGRVSTKGGSTTKQTKKIGSKNPIFISVGHNISLYSAARISAAVSIAKIPEPVRQADLLGRDLLRRNDHGASGV